jgi:hypothetical protein
MRRKRRKKKFVISHFADHFSSHLFPQALDAKAAAKRKAEEERIAKLSPAEQKKVINSCHLPTSNLVTTLI